MALLATVLALMLPTPAEQRYLSLPAASPSPSAGDFSAEKAVHTALDGMNERPAHRSRIPGCNTRACERRVLKKFKIKFARPYRAWLAAVRWCESRGNYRTNTGNGFYGAYQFVLSTWHSVGGWGYPHLNPPYEQDYRAVRLRRIMGTGPWPVCG